MLQALASGSTDASERELSSLRRENTWRAQNPFPRSLATTNAYESLKETFRVSQHEASDELRDDSDVDYSGIVSAQKRLTRI
jgi:hypothetical protein